MQHKSQKHLFTTIVCVRDFNYLIEMIISKTLLAATFKLRRLQKNQPEFFS